MKKEMIKRGLFGLPVGITIGYLISIAVSLLWGNGYYSPCVPEMVLVMGNEICAVIMQTVLCGLLGVSFAATSCIWETDWSLVKQTGVYFTINSIVMMPTAYFTYWMEHSVTGFVTYFGIFFLIFVIMWIIMLLIGRHNVKAMNDKLSQNRTD